MKRNGVQEPSLKKFLIPSQVMGFMWPFPPRAATKVPREEQKPNDPVLTEAAEMTLDHITSRQTWDIDFLVDVRVSSNLQNKDGIDLSSFHLTICLLYFNLLSFNCKKFNFEVH